MPDQRSRSQRKSRVRRRTHQKNTAQGKTLREPGRSANLSGPLGDQLRRYPHPRHYQAASRRHVCRRKIFLAPTAPGTFSLLPTRPTGGASGRLCRSRSRLLRPAPRLDRTPSPSAVGRTLRSHPRPQKRSAAAGACTPETRLVSHSRTGPPETKTASRLPATVASRPRRYSHRHPLQPYL